MHIKLKSHKTKLLRIVLIILLLNLASAYFIINSNIFVISPLDNNSNSINLPKTSDNEITIETPENKTYTEPMSGYYPGTYGFENDEDGTIPDEWTNESSSGLCSISVFDQKENHKKVIFVTDADTGAGTGADATAQHIFKTTQVAGAIEFWVYKESGTTPIYIQCNDGATSAFAVRIDYSNNGKFEFNSGGPWVEFANGKYFDQTWFHLKIEFDCVADLTDIYLNGIREVDDGSFIQPVTDISFIQIRSGYSGETGSLYFDAVGFSWDLNYNIGDNMKEGLLLSYENSTNLDWMGYSFDGGANKTIKGNTTIPLPNDGRHNIQVFGNNSLGANYQSILRYFSIQHITINTPENKTYIEAMSGYYPATYGFENDEDGTIPDEWTNESSSGLCSISVFDLKENHKRVIFVTDADTGAGTGADATAQHTFKTTQVAGTIEFWVYKESGTTPIYVQCNDGATSAFAVRIDYSNNGKFEFNSGGLWVEFANGSYSDQTWFHLKIEFDCVADLTDIYLNGIREVDDGSFIQPVTDISFIQIRSGYSGETGSLYFDAVGFSWDLNYNIGDNMKEGLLLSYENSSNLDWKGYSIDGLENKTILGNTTIPMPADGLHSIQIFGNDSAGRIYNSEIRYFSVDALGPSITINSPTLDDIFNSISPNYDVVITDFNLDKMWYSLDKGINNISFTGLTGMINQDEWNKQLDGNVTLRFLANDSYGRVNYMDVLIEKDTTNPLIIINTPAPNNFYSSTSPDFNLAISELNLDTTWYTLDNGLTNITISEQTGTIDQTEWDKKSDGAVQIRFYANDLVGNEGYSDRSIYKDTLNPIITINTPISGGVFYELPPEFNITVDELNLDSTWYSIDGGLTTFIITETTGFIDSTAWNEASLGAVTLRFYVRDMAGNEIYQEVVVVKRTSEVPPEIPGFNLPILFVMLGLITIISIKIKKNKIK